MICIILFKKKICEKLCNSIYKNCIKRFTICFKKIVEKFVFLLKSYM